MWCHDCVLSDWCGAMTVLSDWCGAMTVFSDWCGAMTVFCLMGVVP